MTSTVNVFKKCSLAAALALVCSSSIAAVINATPNMTPTTSVGFGQQSVAQGNAFEYLYVFNAIQAVGGIYSTVNWTPADTMATATFFKSNDQGVQSGAILGTFTATPGSNLALTYQGIVSGYYTVKVVGTAATGGANTLISGQASPIPVPASLALLGLGMVGLSLVRGRRSV
jgi:hypothetical protein